ncbi:hypothetical protein JB92DRAFT_2871455 [Gautieria morchelliformis]|nr:hypothetical protein JB92DRAFT_2871455 [Gautieria morchelliformis]
MSSGSVEDIIVLGGQFLALMVCEHLLTLGDEVRLYFSTPATSSRQLLAGFLFFVTRYFVPICLSVITAAATTKWGEAVCLVPIGSFCKTVGPLELAFFTVVLIASSILLLLRVYALYNRNKWILGYLSSVILIQFAVCILLSALSDHGLLPMPPIDIPVFQGCLYPPPVRLKNGTLAPVIVEIAYDVSIIGLIMAKGWKDRSLNGLRDRGGILRIIVKDGIIYFLVIFSTMFIWLCMGLFAPVTPALVTDGSANSLVSIMINRLTINLHRSVKSSHGTSLTPSAVPHNAVPFLPTWMINTQDYSSSSDIDNTVISDPRDLALSHESQGIDLVQISSSSCGPVLRMGVSSR